ncbi:MAG: GerMN domain-containing protein [Parcubacteria group bacterium]|nr:GerMN domain-containing protein [Parcubacteria group bacterium]
MNVMKKLLVFLIVIAAGITGFYFFENWPRNPTALKTDLILETIQVKAYFGNENLNPGIMDCSKVFPVTRNVPKTQAVARAALEELLKGPTKAEEKEGYLTSINNGVKIQGLRIDNGIAYADFDRQLEYRVGGSCRVQAIASQIRQTILQFSTVRDVIISIDGRTADILQP